jgi:uncharacterized membrane protein
MSINNIFDFTLWATIIEFIGALIIIAYLLAALITLVMQKDITRARLITADGIITSLSFKLAGTLLKTIALHTWQQILMFAAILALRTALKRLFTWEQARLQQRIRELHSSSSLS